LEIGPGTGQATQRLAAAAGASVVAVELGTALASRLRQTTAGLDVTVVEGDFATVALPSDRFELAVAATAFHWLDPGAALRRLAGLVRPSGWLAVWWTVFGDAGRIPSWRTGLDRLYEQFLPQ
jgi:trans-aconitate methyltransferase